MVKGPLGCWLVFMLALAEDMEELVMGVRGAWWWPAGVIPSVFP